MPIHTASIRAFLLKWETSQTEGYIPCRKRNFTGRNDFAQCGEVIASSGVTIGTGLDLGQQSAKSLRDMGLGATLMVRFAPYLGLSRMAAVAALQRAPLTIMPAQCAELDELVHAHYIRNAAKAYDRAAVLRFEDIPAEAQTVIVSLFYQLGSGPKAYPIAWALLCASAWAGAAHELKTGFKRYANRRFDEGRVLATIQNI